MLYWFLPHGELTQRSRCTRALFVDSLPFRSHGALRRGPAIRQVLISHLFTLKMLL